MSRQLAITKRQAKTLFKAANEEGGIIDVKTEIGVVRIIPAVLARQIVMHEPPVDPEPEGTM